MKPRSAECVKMSLQTLASAIGQNNRYKQEKKDFGLAQKKLYIARVRGCDARYVFQHDLVMSPSYLFGDDGVETYVSSLQINDENLEKVSSLLFQEYQKGLALATHKDADVKMLPSYVTNISTKNENGKFLALDLGGTNFRVLLINLNNGECSIKNEIYSVPSHIMTGPGIEILCDTEDPKITLCIFVIIFDYSCLITLLIACPSLLSNMMLSMKNCLLVLHSVFPVNKMDSLMQRLIKWTKGFSCSGVEGENVAELLQEAIKRNGKISIDVVAILNDTVGTLMSVAYFKEDCAVGMIVGTGTNACYLENIENVELFNTERLKSQNEKQVIINTEWGAFGNNGVFDFLKTKYDCEIDTNSINPGCQIYEKMIGGMYLGEIVRIVLVDLSKKKLIFKGVIPEKLLSKDGFLTKYISLCESDEGTCYEKIEEVLQEIGVINPSEEDCKTVKYICKLISTRAAHLAACGLSAILRKMKKPKVTIACDGSLIKYHPHFLNSLESKLKCLSPGVKVSAENIDFKENKVMCLSAILRKMKKPKVTIACDGSLIKYHPHFLNSLESKLKCLSPGVKFELILSEDGSGRGAALVAAAAVSK
ncbi:Hexokinase type 2 [Nymphon striatum]|nr:Hexokinase type 2 [Nymphon striatum]